MIFIIVKVIVRLHSCSKPRGHFSQFLLSCQTAKQNQESFNSSTSVREQDFEWYASKLLKLEQVYKIDFRPKFAKRSVVLQQTAFEQLLKKNKQFWENLT